MPPCNCHPPFPRPEPFSPLPRPGKIPDWGKWIRDRLSEKGALLVFPTRASFPSPGAWPNLYLDQETGAVYRWDREDYAVLFGPREGNDVLVYDSVAAFPDEGEQGKLYIAANTGGLYRWGGEGYVALLPGKADKVVPQAAGNFAELTQDGNLADSGKKPADFATAAQGAKADTAVQSIAVGASTVEPGEGGVLALPVSSSTTSSSETTIATSKAVKTVDDKVVGIEGKIPSQASASNQLADKAFVNSSVATNTATFRGTFNLVTDLQLPLDATHNQVAQAIRVALVAAGVTPDDNDYVFVQIPQDLEHTDAMKQVDRYKCTVVGSSQTWAYEWTLNNSSFTAAQWAAINSGITSGAVAKLGALPTADELAQALAGKATKADATLTERGFTAWACNPATDSNGQAYHVEWQDRGWATAWFLCAGNDHNPVSTGYSTDVSATRIEFTVSSGTVVATRTALQGYVLGSQSDKPLASEAEAEALRIGKQDELTAQQLANIAAVSDALAFDATHTYEAGDPVVYNGTLYTFTSAHTGAWTGTDVSAVDIIARLAGKLDKSGGTMTGGLTMNEQVGIGFGDGAIRIYQANGSLRVHDFHTEYESALVPDGSPFATHFNIPYDLGTPIVIDAASSDPEGEMIYFGAATLADHTANIVQVIAPLDELRITFPAATSGNVRDFGLRVEIGTGSAALTAPALVPVAPTGETIKIENADRTIPELADGTETAKGVTLLYFSENAPGVFVVKGEQVEEVA